MEYWFHDNGTCDQKNIDILLATKARMGGQSADGSVRVVFKPCDERVTCAGCHEPLRLGTRAFQITIKSAPGASETKG